MRRILSLAVGGLFVGVVVYLFAHSRGWKMPQLPSLPSWSLPSLGLGNIGWFNTSTAIWLLGVAALAVVAITVLYAIVAFRRHGRRNVPPAAAPQQPQAVPIPPGHPAAPADQSRRGRLLGLVPVIAVFSGVILIAWPLVWPYIGDIAKDWTGTISWSWQTIAGLTLVVSAGIAIAANWMLRRPVQAPAGAAAARPERERRPRTDWKKRWETLGSFWGSIHAFVGVLFIVSLFLVLVGSIAIWIDSKVYEGRTFGIDLDGPTAKVGTAAVTEVIPLSSQWSRPIQARPGMKFAAATDPWKADLVLRFTPGSSIYKIPGGSYEPLPHEALEGKWRYMEIMTTYKGETTLTLTWTPE